MQNKARDGARGPVNLKSIARDGVPGAGGACLAPTGAKRRPRTFEAPAELREHEKGHPFRDALSVFSERETGLELSVLFAKVIEIQ